ncbi:MAG: DUF2306 domain-containing protein [Paracoccaceae bacterium]
MIRLFARPLPLVLALAFGIFIPVMMAGVRLVQILLSALPDDSLRLAAAPVALFLHALAGILFGVLGPVQFARALRQRFGALHRLSGRVFVAAGLALALSGLALLVQIESQATAVLDNARAGFSAALIVALGVAVSAAGRRDMIAHRAWMIRAYAIGMGGATVALVMFPIYLIKGAPLTGLASDLVFVGWWLVTLAIGEWVILRLGRRQGALT